MNDVTRHYEDLLAPHYSWMTGLSLADKIAEQTSLLGMLGLPGNVRRYAVDLGSGPGYQSFALANMGYEVVLAIDTSRFLLDELEAARGSAPVQTVLADLRVFSKFVTLSGADAIVCMGDTLTHLETRADVTKLFQDAFERLAPEGLLRAYVSQSIDRTERVRSIFANPCRRKSHHDLRLGLRTGQRSCQRSGPCP